MEIQPQSPSHPRSSEAPRFQIPPPHAQLRRPLITITGSGLLVEICPAKAAMLGFLIFFA